MMTKTSGTAAVIAIIAATATASFDAVAAKPEPGVKTNEYRFVGFSQAAVLGNVGYAGVHGACQASFGPEARQCFSEEVIRTPNIANLTEEREGWVQPTFLFEGNIVVDVSGFALSHDQGRGSCGGWSTPDLAKDLGLVLDARKMTFSEASCTATLPVACCLPR